MDNVQDEITIISGDEAMSFSLEPDGTLSLECVKVYFPDALGLVCDVKDDEGVTKIKALSIKNGQIKMEPNVKEYRVRYKSTKVDKVESIATTSTLKANATKKERVNLYRRIMEGNNIKPAGKDDDILERQNKISDLRKVSPSPGPAKLKLAPKYKTISVGWKHRYAEDVKYNQQKFPVGGSRSFQLDTAVKYNVDDIIQMGIRAFTHETAVVLLKLSTIKLGFHNCEEITSFSLPNGTECGLFEYYKCNNLSSNRIQLYLLSTSVEMNASLSQTIGKTAVDTAVQENYNSENENNTNTEVVAKIHHLPDKSLKDITNTNFDNFDQQVKYEEQPGQNTSKSDRSPCTYEPVIKVALINNSKDDVIIQSEQHTSNCDHSPCAYVPIGKAALIDDSKDELMMQNDNFKDDLIMQPQQHASKCDDSPTTEEPLGELPLNDDLIMHEESVPEFNKCGQSIEIITNNFNQVSILYMVIGESKYSKETYISHRDNIGIFWHVVDNDEEYGMTLDQDSFDPTDFGYEISQIIVNGKHLYQVEVDENLRKVYIYPDSNEGDLHKIIHNTNEVVGFANDHLGIGVIPVCSPECKPQFSWFRNDILFKEGKMLMWLHNLPLTSEDTWYCKITCSEGCNETSKKICISNTQCQTVKLTIQSVPEIKKIDFDLSKELIGAGQQGKVYKGSFNKQIVAIKCIKLYTRNTKNVEKEIAVLETIKHENFIHLLAVSRDIKQVYLIMEYFKNSAPLSDVIFDEDLKNTYNFNLRKNDISKQICTAIAYLHAQSNPIIHRDLKPENVLINLNGLVKICDFGLSRFSITIASLRTTVGSKIMGTIMYMAPEILIDREEASLKSEIWSLACILWEIFNENSIWDVNDQEELEEKYRNKEVPSMINIPEEVQPCLQQCFSYESSYRPLAADILNSINKSNA